MTKDSISVTVANITLSGPGLTGMRGKAGLGVRFAVVSFPSVMSSIDAVATSSVALPCKPGKHRSKGNGFEASVVVRKGGKKAHVVLYGPRIEEVLTSCRATTPDTTTIVLAITKIMSEAISAVCSRPS